MRASIFIKTLAPDFCWCNSRDLFNMYLLLNEDADELCFYQTLFHQKRQGVLFYKPDTSVFTRHDDFKRRGPRAGLYLRK